MAGVIVGATVLAAAGGARLAPESRAAASIPATTPPPPFLEVIAPHRLRWGVVTNGASFTRVFRVPMGSRVSVKVRGAFGDGTVAARIEDAARRVVFSRTYSQSQRPTGVVQHVRGRPGRWTVTLRFRSARNGPFLIEATG